MFYSIIRIVLAEVVEWQTRRLQVPVVAIPCGFKSHLPHAKSFRRKSGAFFACGRWDIEPTWALPGLLGSTSSCQGTGMATNFVQASSDDLLELRSLPNSHLPKGHNTTSLRHRRESLSSAAEDEQEPRGMNDRKILQAKHCI